MAGARHVMIYLTGLVMVLAIVFGGGTHQGFLGDTIIQLAAVPLLIAGLWQVSLRAEPVPGALRGALIIIAAFFAVGLLQLIPLPEALRVNPADFPARVPSGFPQDVFHHATISISPQATWAALLSVVPPVAVFLAVAQLPNAGRRRVAHIIIALGCISALLGLLQVAHGPRGPLRFYSVTNPAEAVGFFANRNHFAALLYTTILISAPILVSAARGLAAAAPHRDRSIMRFLLSFAIVVMLMIGVIMARSRMGILLGLVALGTVAALSFVSLRNESSDSRPGERPRKTGLLIAALVAVAIVGGLALGLHRAAPRFGLSVADDVRIPILLATLDAARLYLPFGSGLGTFVPAYAAHEPVEAIFSAFANRAHNDFAEFLLEYGAFGAAIIIAALVWVLARGRAIWLSTSTATSSATTTLSRACWVAVVLVLMHGAVEYGLRTSALACVFAFCCGVIATRAETGTRAGDGRRGKSSSTAPPQSTPAAAAWPASSPSTDSQDSQQEGPTKGWRDHKNWPAEWRNESEE